MSSQQYGSLVLLIHRQRVIELSKQYLPTMAVGYADPRVKVHIRDGAEYLDDHKAAYDVIITDSSDPIGEAYVEHTLSALSLPMTEPPRSRQVPL